MPKLAQAKTTLLGALWTTSFWSMIAAMGSAVGSGFAYLAAQQANQTGERANAIASESANVARLAQDFTERLYKDQLALNAPALAITGGHIDGRAWRDQYGQPVYAYTLNFTLRNSGGRDARASFVALDQSAVSGTYEVPLDTLPKDSDIQIRVPLRPSADLKAEWNVAVAYSDDVPTHTLATPPTTTSPATLTRICAPALAVSLSSMPGIHQTLQDSQWADVWVLSAGAPSSAASYIRGIAVSEQLDSHACVSTLAIQPS